MDNQLIFAPTIYDICKQQDCLSPECDSINPESFLISPARNGTGFEVEIVDEITQEHYHIPPNGVLYITDDYGYISVVDNLIETVMSVSKFKESTFKKGWYDLEIQYRFNFSLKFFDLSYQPKIVYINSTPVYMIQAFTTYTKKLTLCGGEAKNIVTTLSSNAPQCCSIKPEYNIQATTDLLKTTLNPISDLVCNPFVAQSENLVDDSGGFVVCLTIGLFTIISLFRYTKLNVLTDNITSIPSCNNILSPCEDFNTTPFPYDLFNTPDCKHCK